MVKVTIQNKRAGVRIYTDAGESYTFAPGEVRTLDVSLSAQKELQERTAHGHSLAVLSTRGGKKRRVVKAKKVRRKK